MIPSLKSELRKIWTVRSTYIVLLFSLVVMVFFAFYIEGIRAGESSKALNDPTKLATLILDAITNLGTFGALVGILSFTHEYRFNTIMYTLTASRSRARSLLAKFTAVSLYSVFFTVFVSVFVVALMYLGLAFKGAHLVHQVIPSSVYWRVLFVGWGYCMFGVILAGLIRHQVGAVMAFFLIPGLGEALAGLLLKSNSRYLPFTSLQQVTHLGNPEAFKIVLAPGKAALVVLTYLVVGWIITLVLFLKRDAN